MPLNYRLRIYIPLFFSVLAFAFGCSQEKVPEDLIEPKQMAALLTQVHMIDGALYNFNPSSDTLYKYGMARYLDLFKKFRVDTGLFRRSYRYYSLHPKLFVPVYEQVSQNLKTKQDSLNKLQQKELTQPKKPDTSHRTVPPPPNLKPHTNDSAASPHHAPNGRKNTETFKRKINPKRPNIRNAVP